MKTYQTVKQIAIDGMVIITLMTIAAIGIMWK